MKQIHGGNTCQFPDILDFSANLNPLGMPDVVRRAVIASAAQWEQYPDPDCTKLVQKLSDIEKIPPFQLVCGNGAADLIYRLVHAFRPKSAVLCAPTFGEYAKALGEVGCRIREYYLREEDDFSPKEDILSLLTPETDMLFLCTPNNPTGQLTEPILLARISQHCAENGILLVCDECFLDFAEHAAEYSLRRCMMENAVILKAFTKLYAMPGLRLGYAVCGSAMIAERLRHSGQFWSVSAPAQAAGIAALDETEFARKTVERITKERRFLAENLAQMGLRVYPSAVNFLLFRGNAGLDDRLLREGILIRNCADYSGLGQGYYRIAVRNHDENLRLLAAIGRCI